MNPQVFLQTIRLGRRTLIIAGLGVMAFTYVTILGASTLIEDFGVGAEADGFLRNPPRAVEALSGGSLDFFSPVGWISSAIMHPITLTLQTMAALTMAVSLPTEAERGTLDLVLSRPISRTSYLLSKAAAALSAVFLVQLAGLAVVLLARATLGFSGEVAISGLLRLFAGTLTLFAAFAMICLLISARSSLRSRALGMSAGVVVGSFFLNFIGLLFERLEFIRYLSPFYYLAPSDLLTGNSGAAGLLVLTAIAGAAVAGAVAVFRTRDLTR